MAHTPGPWIADTTHPERTLYIVWARDLIIADVVDDQHDNAEANARLIAAAPDLLAALRAVNAELIELYERAYPDDETDNDTTAAIDMAIAAIAKAEGE